MYRTIVNGISLSRVIGTVVLIPAVLLIPPGFWLPLCIVLIAGTDWLDGFLARKWQIADPTGMGGKLDRIADKVCVNILTQFLALYGWVMTAEIGWRLALMLVLVAEIYLIRDIIVERFIRAETPIPVGWAGKCKTAVQFLLIILLGVHLGVTPIAKEILWTLTFIAAFLSIFSAFIYYKRAQRAKSGG